MPGIGALTKWKPQTGKHKRGPVKWKTHRETQKCLGNWVLGLIFLVNFKKVVWTKQKKRKKLAVRFLCLWTSRSLAHTVGVREFRILWRIWTKKDDNGVSINWPYLWTTPKTNHQIKNYLFLLNNNFPWLVNAEISYYKDFFFRRISGDFNAIVFVMVVLVQISALFFSLRASSHEQFWRPIFRYYDNYITRSG